MKRNNSNHGNSKNADKKDATIKKEGEKPGNNQAPTKDKAESVVIKASVQDIKDGILAANKEEKKINGKKILSAVGKFLLTTIAGILLTIICTWVHETLFKAELDVKSVQMEIVGDGTVGHRWQKS